MMRFHSLPYIGQKEQFFYYAKRLTTGVRNLDNITSIQHFSWKNEIHETKKIFEMISMIDPEEREMFDLDFRKID